jgi:hypothetical protein
MRTVVVTTVVEEPVPRVYVSVESVVSTIVLVVVDIDDEGTASTVEAELDGTKSEGLDEAWLEGVPEAECEGVEETGHTVVEIATVFVDRTVESAGQYVTVGAQLVTVTTEVAYTVDVVDKGLLVVCGPVSSGVVTPVPNGVVTPVPGAATEDAVLLKATGPVELVWLVEALITVVLVGT